MKRLLSTACSDTSFNISAFVLRVSFGLIMLIQHGIDKMQNFANYSSKFADPIHLGQKPSLILVIFAELFCSIFLILGLFTRLFVIPLVINMAVIVFIVLKGKPMSMIELPALYLAVYVAILLMGPGKYSVDGAMGK